jgi:hypothetical protein
MTKRVGRAALAAFIVAMPAMALAGDGTFGVPASGVLLPPPPQPRPVLRGPEKVVAPSRTAALVPPDRAAPEKQRAVQRVQQTYQPAPAEGAGRSRPVPPSEAPEHSPIVVPPKSKQFRAPVARVDPSYVERLDGDAGAGQQPAAISTPAPVTPPVMAQGAAPEQKRGGLFALFGRRKTDPQPAQSAVMPVQAAPVYASAASAGYEEYVSAAPAPAQTAYAPQPAPQPTASRLSFGGAKPSVRAGNGTPCGQLRGLFTSPPECR